MSTALVSRLFALQDEAYRDFESRLLPTLPKEKIIGVRVPALRALARELAGTAQAADFLSLLPHRYYEENNLHAILLSDMDDFEAAKRGTDAFVPFLDNWAACDMLNPKVFRAHRGQLLPWIGALLSCEEIYTVRFGIDMLMVHFLEEDFTPAVLEMAAAVRSEEYYVNMAAAWFFATALAKQYDSALPYLAGRRLPPWVHSRTIQKALESCRIPPARKAYLKTLRRNRSDGKL